MVKNATLASVPRWRVFPAGLRLDKRGDAWSMTPRANIPSGSDVNAVYGINQQARLSDYDAAGQVISFNVAFSGRGPNPFTDPETPDHVVVGLNHRTFFDEDGNPTGNAFAGIAIGLAGPCEAGVCIEWRNDELGLPLAFSETCYVPVSGTTSLSFLFEAFADGRANAYIIGSTGVHTLSGCHPDLASPYAGAAIAGLSGGSTSRYSLGCVLSGPQRIYA